MQAETAHGAIAGLQRLADVFLERRRQLAAEAGLTETQWRVLEEIAGEGFLPSLFARRQSVTRAAVSRTLRQLSEGGWVTSKIGADDGRQRQYAPTAKGRRALQRVYAAREAAVRAVWADLPEAELRRFGTFADELATRLEAYAGRR